MKNVKSFNTSPLEIVKDEMMKKIIKELAIFIYCIHTRASGNDPSPMIDGDQKCVDKVYFDRAFKGAILAPISEWDMEVKEVESTTMYNINFIYKTSLENLEVMDFTMNMIRQYQPLVDTVSVFFEKEQDQRSSIIQSLSESASRYRAGLRVTLSRKPNTQDNYIFTGNKKRKMYVPTDRSGDSE